MKASWRIASSTSTGRVTYSTENARLGAHDSGESCSIGASLCTVSRHSVMVPTVSHANYKYTLTAVPITTAAHVTTSYHGYGHSRSEISATV